MTENDRREIIAKVEESYLQKARKDKDTAELIELLCDYGRNYNDCVKGVEHDLAEYIITAGYKNALRLAMNMIVDLDQALHKMLSPRDTMVTSYETGRDDAIFEMFRHRDELLQKYTGGNQQ